MRMGLALLVAITVLATACSDGDTTTSSSSPTSSPQGSMAPTSTADRGPKPVIVDYSPTVSDVGGLMYLLASPEVEVIAISLPVTGEAGCELGLEVTLGILELVDQSHVPVACDPDFPPDAEQWPADFLQGASNLTFGLPSVAAAGGDQTGTELIVDAATSSPQPVTIWAVAPMTNLARALDAGIESNIEEIVIMGGAVDVPGNVFDSPAEWNLFIDAAASAYVVSSGVPITLVALDATNEVPVPGWLPLALARAEQSEEITYLTRMVDLFDTPQTGFYFMWDELAAAVAADAVDVVTQQVDLAVVVGGPNSGQTARDETGSQVTLVTDVVSPDAFYTDFISVLAGSRFQKAEATAEERAYLTAVAGSLDEFGEALESTFGPDSPFGSDEFDGEAVVAVLEPVFNGMAATSQAVGALDPPASLANLHRDYLDEVNSDLDLRESILEGLMVATSWDEAFGLLGGFSDGSACEAMANEAFFLGVEAEFPCNP